MAGLMRYNECRGKAIFVVQGAAANGVAHPSDRSIAWEGIKGDSESLRPELYVRQPGTL